MSFSKKFLLVCLVFALLLISSEVVSALRDLAEETTASTQNSNTDGYHGYPPYGHRPPFGYPPYGHRPPYYGHPPYRCRHGCHGETTTTTENSNTDGYHGGHGGHYGGGGGGGHYGGGGGGHHGGGAHETETKN